jgi:hypothetical protein
MSVLVTPTPHRIRKTCCLPLTVPLSHHPGGRGVVGHRMTELVEQLGEQPPAEPRAAFLGGFLS